MRWHGAVWMTGTVVEVIKSFQIGISALIGFAGVCLTLAVNACISRRAERRLRCHQQQVLRTAFKGEIALLKDRFVYFRNLLGSKPASLTVPLHSRCLVFDANIVNLGLLSENEASSILSFYISIREGEDFLAAQFPVVTEDQNRHRITYTGTGLEVFQWSLESRISEAQRALDELYKHDGGRAPV